MIDILHIYTRVSTVQQSEENYSLDSQKTLGVKRAEQLGMDHKVWDEGPASSSSEDFSNRPTLMELLSEIEEGNVKHLFVFNTDRLSRSEQSWMMIKMRLLNAGVKLYTSSGEYDLTDAMSSMLLTFMGAIANYDNKLRTERFRLGKIQNLKRNNSWKGGPPPFGYGLENKHLVPDSKECLWVETIYQMYSEGETLNAIRQHLMNNGVRTRRGNLVWNGVSIRKILENTHYAGYYSFTDGKSGESFRVKCPQILRDELVEKVREIQKKRSYRQGTASGRSNKSKTSETLLGDLLYCGSCGTKCGAKVSMSNKKQKPYYYCMLKYQPTRNQKSAQKTCDSSRNASIDNLDTFVWARVIETLSESSLFQEQIKTKLFADHNNLTPEEIRKINKQIKGLKKELETIETSISSLTATQMITGTVSEGVIAELEKNRTERETRLKGLEKTLHDNKLNKKWLDWVKMFGEQISELKNSELSLVEKKKFMDGVVDKVSVTGKSKNKHEVKIEFTIPCVGDKLVWRNPSKKSLGYTIEDGSSELTVLMEPC